MIASSFIANILARLQAYRAYRQRVRELESLDDRELRDLGISRADIFTVASQPA